MKTLLLHNISDVFGRYTISKKKYITIATKNVIISFDDGYQSVYKELMAHEDLNYSQYLLFLPAGKMGYKNDWDQTGELSGHPIMTWESAFELHKLGVRIGSHGLDHLDLTKLPDRELENELKESKGLIEEKINGPVESLAYPFGYFNDRVIAAVKAAGYKEAYTTCDSILQGRGNPYRKRRVEITGTEPDWLVTAKVNGLYDLRVIFELPILAAQKTIIKLSKNTTGVQ